MHPLVIDKKSIRNRIICCMGIAYLLFLIWAILWKCGIPYIGDGTERIINLLPFNNNTRWELQFNIAIFMPFGFYATAYCSKFGLVRLAMLSLLTSLVLETFQFVLAVGRSDITDLLMNMLGGFVGIAAFYIVSKLFGRYANTVAFVVCVLLTLFLLYMTLSFILFGQLHLGFIKIKL